MDPNYTNPSFTDPNFTDPTAPIFNADHKNETYYFYGYAKVIPLSLLMLVFMALAIAGNIMVVLTILRHKGMRTRTNMFIVNLAVADILVAILDMPFSLVTIVEGDWIFGDSMCKLNGFTMALFLICSIHTLMYISIHKYISITRPFSRAMTPRRIRIMISAAWIWATFCALGPLIGWSSITYKKGASQCGPKVPENLSHVYHSLFITTTNYIIPLTVMSFCYYRIFREIHVHMGRIRETSNINLESSVAQQKKVSVTLFLVLVCFFLCWTPFVGYSTVLSFLKDKQKMPLFVNPVAYWFGYFNSACNPIIYAFRSPSFRQGYKAIMCGRTTSAIHSGNNSLSFRTRSYRGSMKSSNSNLKGTLTRRGTLDPLDPKPPKPKRMLSQTSWISLPILPYLVRSVSSAKGKETAVATESDEFDFSCCLQCQHKRNRPKVEDPEPENYASRKFSDAEFRKHCAIIEENGDSVSCTNEAVKVDDLKETSNSKPDETPRCDQEPLAESPDSPCIDEVVVEIEKAPIECEEKEYL